MSQRRLTPLLYAASVSASLFLSEAKDSILPSPIPQNQRPNVIFIYADDMGKGMLSAYGQKHVKTPNIDQIFQEGVSFNNAYGCVFCAPARASILTGYHDCRTGNQRKWNITRAAQFLNQSVDHTADLATLDQQLQAIENKIDETDIRLTQENDLYLGQVFQRAGYTTYTIGKLDYGFTATRRQMKEHGWDHYYGYLDHVRCHGYYPPYLFEDGKVFKIAGNTKRNCSKEGEGEHNINMRKNRWKTQGKAVYSEDLFIAKALEIVQAKHDKPYFLFYATQLPHGPTSTQYKTNDNPSIYGPVSEFPTVPVIDQDILENPELTWIEKEYAQMIRILDTNVGKMIAEVKKQGQMNNTIFIFSADNGHEIYYSQPVSTGRVNKSYHNYATGKRFQDNQSNGAKYNSKDAHDVFDGNAGMSGHKWITLNGGTNVQLAFYWKGKIQGGRACNELVANYDLLPTFADLFNIPICKKDGLSYRAMLFDPQAKFPQDRYVVYSGGHGGKGAIVRNDGFTFRTAAGGELHNLKKDPKQLTNVKEQYPQIHKELNAILTREAQGK